MDNLKLQQDIDDMRQKLADMESKLNAPIKHNYFTLTNGDSYWCVTQNGLRHSEFYDGCGFDEYNFSVGNCYETKQQAEQALAKQKAYVRIIRALRDHEGDFVIDWNDDDQERAYISYAFGSEITPKGFIIDRSTIFQRTTSELYSTEESCQWVIDNMQDDLKIYFGVK